MTVEFNGKSSSMYTLSHISVNSRGFCRFFIAGYKKVWGYEYNKIGFLIRLNLKTTALFVNRRNFFLPQQESALYNYSEHFRD